MKHDAIRTLPPVEISQAARERLNAYVLFLQSWSRTVNLVSQNDLAELWPRHIEDSLQLLPLIPNHGPMVDLGSGAGFPGIVLAIAADRTIHLVEADHRKAAFLREAARVTNANVTVECTRIESLNYRGASAVTARALSSLDQLLTWSAPLLDSGGVCLFPKGRQYEAELTKVMPHWHMRVQRWQSRTNPQAVILELSELSRYAGPTR